MATYNYKDLEIFYHDKGKGKNILFLHGDTASTELFLNEIDILSKDYRVIAPDLPGHGKSSRIKRFPLNFWKFSAEVFLSMIEDLNLSDVNILGISGGSIIALNMVILNDSNIDKVMIDSFLGKSIPRGVAFSIQKSRASMKGIGQGFWQAMHGIDWEDVVDADTNMLVEFSKRIENFYDSELLSIKKKVMIVSTDKSKVIDLINDIPNSDYYIFENGEDPLIISEQDRFKIVLDNFFN
ncbi:MULTISPECIES: alpha/beta fold hydrolase [Oceanotoga]|jgi:pimeloyl-ACP methyl ester carboxylesterase|uniref:alpha/beta fold hydrolase n=1 Tax=Oceanotoga TaxID=1255275 RepID=UPI0026524980|nr:MULTISPECIES: alpha/beta fold hydrolase [Oceanotoga]MDN5342853.1 hypothetical protein [Oceanotoga sp.]MDO7976332.1 alpha/beta hydrolase [Oceanotoga teriensis]